MPSRESIRDNTVRADRMAYRDSADRLPAVSTISLRSAAVVAVASRSMSSRLAHPLSLEWPWTVDLPSRSSWFSLWDGSGGPGADPLMILKRSCAGFALEIRRRSIGSSRGRWVARRGRFHAPRPRAGPSIGIAATIIDSDVSLLVSTRRGLAHAPIVTSSRTRTIRRGRPNAHGPNDPNDPNDLTEQSVEQDDIHFSLGDRCVKGPAVRRP